jgi:hypothetical protein
MKGQLQRVREALDRLELELSAWEQQRSEDRRRRAQAEASAAARELQVLLNALRPTTSLT